MTPEQRRLILSMIIGGSSTGVPSDNEVLAGFGETDGSLLSARLVASAIENRSAEELDLATVVAHLFGPTPQLLQPHTSVLLEDWHHTHENIVALLDDLRSPGAIPAFVHAAVHVPDYLEFDDARALAVKAIWALGNLAVPEADEALRSLRDSESEVVRANVRKQLERHRHAPTD